MKAAVWYGGKDIRIENVPKPEIRDDEVLVRVRAAGICGSELHAYEGISERRKPPLVMGHEFAGEVADIGKQVEGFKKGDRVVIEPITRCGICEQCLRGRGNVCRNVKLLGLHVNGAFAEYVPAPARNSYKIPDNVSYEEASTSEPLAVAVHAANRAPVKLGDTVVIIGAGIIGLNTLQVAKLAGAGKVFVTDVVDYRLDFAKKLGADVVINSKIEDPVKRVMELTGTKGVDVALEAVGIQATVQQAMSMVGIGGKIIVIGMLEKTMPLGMLDVVVKELDIKGSYGYVPDDFKAALDIIDNRKADVKSLVTNVLPLNDIVKGFELLHKKVEGVIKVVLKP